MKSLLPEILKYSDGKTSRVDEDTLDELRAKAKNQFFNLYSKDLVWL